MSLSSDVIESGARFLAQRCLSGQAAQRLAEHLRPNSLASALAMQVSRSQFLGQKVGGWKCLEPQGEQLIIAPIYEPTIHSGPTCPILLDENRCRVEPELAFTLKESIGPSNQAYTKADLKPMVTAHMALELIQNRNWDEQNTTFHEKLADCLLNQGLYVGPEVDIDAALAAETVQFHLSYGQHRSNINGIHPNRDPFAPFVWLVNYLTGQGLSIAAGSHVITGSYAGVLNVPKDTPIELKYSGLGSMKLTLID